MFWLKHVVNVAVLRQIRLLCPLNPWMTPHKPYPETLYFRPPLASIVLALVSKDTRLILHSPLCWCRLWWNFLIHITILEVSRRERIPASASTVEGAYGGLVLKCKKKSTEDKHHMSPWSSRGISQASGRRSCPICLETVILIPCFF